MPVIDFRQAPTLARAWHDDARTRIVVGPVGSGKTTWCVGVIGARMLSAPICRDGVRRYRAAVVRTSLPTMRTTTLQTWKAWYPPAQLGHLREQAPIMHTIRKAARRGEPALHAEIIFLGLDDQQSIDRLKSFEITDLYMAELSELDEHLFEMARGRIGRYPPVDWMPEGTRQDHEARVMRLPNGSAWYPKTIADTNQVDDQHWLYGVQMDPPQGWSIYRQPPAVLECERVGDVYRPVTGEPGRDEYTFKPSDIIDQAGRHWAVNPQAENRDNVIAGYYEDQQLPGASIEYIRRYLQSKPVYLEEGRPVVPEFNQELHTVDETEILAETPLRVGVDAGGGTMRPAAVISQRHPRGIHIVHRELTGENVGTETFLDQLIPVLEQYGLAIEVVWCDPATRSRDEIFETAVIEHMRSRGLPAKPCDTNDQQLRIQSLRAPFNRMVDGRPAIVVSRRGCPKLVRGLGGKYRFRKINVTGTDGPRFAESPEKNEWSHPCEALGYDLYGGGEGRRFRKGESPKPKTTRTASTSWDPLAS